MKKIFLVSAFFLIYSFGCLAQQCGNCKQTPSVANYDLDVQVPKPDVNDLKSNEWLEWLQLFWLNKHAQSALFQTNKNCIRFTQPSDARISNESFETKDGVEVTPLNEESRQIKVGETYTNLPPSGDVSKFGNYITTGYVKKSGNGYVMHMEIQTACSRKTVAGVDVAFQASSDSKYMEGIAQQAAAKLSPIIDKIKKFELDERQLDKKLSLYQTSWDEPIKVTPQKKTLKAGESTEITIEVKDCDGIPLEGREILFNETAFEGLKIFGTMGGTVTPAKVVTDVNGKAKARFTLKSGAKEAIINAHSPGNQVKGCASMLIGDAAINIRKVYSGFVKYSYDEGANCEERSTSESGVRTDFYSANNVFKVDYTASFYIDEKGQTSFSGEEETKSPTDIPNVMESGNMIYKTKEIRRGKVANNPPNEQVITKDQSGGLTSGSVSFGLNNNAPSVDLSLKFLLKGTSSFKQTYLPSGSQPANENYNHSVSFTHYDGNLKYTKTTDGGKIKHNFTYSRDGSAGCKQIVERMQLQVIEE